MDTASSESRAKPCMVDFGLRVKTFSREQRNRRAVCPAGIKNVPVRERQPAGNKIFLSMCLVECDMGLRKCLYKETVLRPAQGV